MKVIYTTQKQKYIELFGITSQWKELFKSGWDFLKAVTDVKSMSEFKDSKVYQLAMAKGFNKIVGKKVMYYGKVYFVQGTGRGLNKAQIDVSHVSLKSADGGGSKNLNLSKIQVGNLEEADYLRLGLDSEQVYDFSEKQLNDLPLLKIEPKEGEGWHINISLFKDRSYKNAKKREKLKKLENDIKANKDLPIYIIDSANPNKPIKLDQAPTIFKAGTENMTIQVSINKKSITYSLGEIKEYKVDKNKKAIYIYTDKDQDFNLDAEPTKEAPKPGNETKPAGGQAVPPEQTTPPTEATPTGEETPVAEPSDEEATAGDEPDTEPETAPEAPVDEPEEDFEREPTQVQKDAIVSGFAYAQRKGLSYNYKGKKYKVGGMKDDSVELYQGDQKFHLDFKKIDASKLRTNLVEFSTKEWQNQGSNVTARTYKDRRTKVSMAQGFTCVDFDPVEAVAYFLVKPTPTGEIKTTDLRGNLSLDTAYTAQVQFMDWESLIDSWETCQFKDFRALLQVCDLKFHCDDPSFHWTGIRFQLSQVDSAIHPITKRDKIWRDRHGDSKVPTLCKHLMEIVNGLIFRAPEIFQQMKRKMRK